MREALWALSGRGAPRYPDHIGLAYEVWAPVGSDGKIPDDGRQTWLADLCAQPVSRDYRRFFERWRGSFTAPGDRCTEMRTSARLLIGHGNMSATDVGISVHHTWGVPVIPGAAQKGLVAHYLDAVYGPRGETTPFDPRLTGEEALRERLRGVVREASGRPLHGPGDVYRVLFGAPDALHDSADRELGAAAGAARGGVVFHDALFVPSQQGASEKPDRPFAPDVLTVHQKSYYNGQGKVLPSDYDSPNPVSFLSVRPQTAFLIALSGAPDATELALGLLQEALVAWGVGGKTAAGYGRFEGIEPSKSSLGARVDGELAPFLSWLNAQKGKLEQRELLNALEREWLPRLQAFAPDARRQAAAEMGRRIKSPKLQGAVAILQSKLQG